MIRTSGLNMNAARTKILKLPFVAGAALITILGGTGLILVFLFTGAKHSNSETPSSQEISTAQSPLSPVDNSKRAGDSVKQTIHSIEDLSKFTTYFSRSVALGTMLGEANLQQTLNLLDESKQLSDTALRQTTQVEIFRRLASLEPELALSQTHDFLSVQRKLYQSVIFQEWSSSDISAVVAYTEQHLQELDWGLSRMILNSILNSDASLSDDTKQDIAKRFGLEYYYSQMSESAQRTAMLENPVEHWNLLLHDQLNDNSQTEDFVDVALAVVAKDGFEEFMTMYAELTDRFSRNKVLHHVLLDRLRTDEFETVFNDAVSLLDNTNRSIVFDVADRWFQQDASATFEALSQLQDEGLRDDLLESTALRLADTNPLRTLEQLETLPESVKGIATYLAVFRLTASDPIEAVKHLSKLNQYPIQEDEDSPYARDAKDRMTQVALNLFSNWIRADVLAAFEWLLSDPIVAHVRSEAHFEIKRAVTANNAEAMIEIALKQSKDESGVELEGVILSRLALIDFDKAKDLLPKMRAGDARVLGYAAIGAGIFYRENDPERSIEFAKELPELERAEYYLQLADRWASHNGKETYAHIDLLPSAEAKARAASALIRRQGSKKELSDEEIEHLKSYLPEEE